LTST